MISKTKNTLMQASTIALRTILQNLKKKAINIVKGRATNTEGRERAAANAIKFCDEELCEIGEFEAARGLISGLLTEFTFPSSVRASLEAYLKELGARSNK